MIMFSCRIVDKNLLPTCFKLTLIWLNFNPLTTFWIWRKHLICTVWNVFLKYDLFQYIGLHAWHDSFRKRWFTATETSSIGPSLGSLIFHRTRSGRWLVTRMCGEIVPPACNHLPPPSPPHIAIDYRLKSPVPVFITVVWMTLSKFLCLQVYLLIMMGITNMVKSFFQVLAKLTLMTKSFTPKRLQPISRLLFSLSTLCIHFIQKSGNLSSSFVVSIK